jgi:2-dehydropantoate 2-reductase
MKIAIVGAGAIGGYVGAKLALSGENVTFIARGANLASIRTSGMKLIAGDRTELIADNVQATSDYAEAGPQDLVILAVKAHQLEAVASEVPKLFAAETVVVTMQNGIPYWYFHRHGGPLEGHRLQSVDPAGLIAESISPQRVLGCVVYPAAELLAPGVIGNVDGNRFPIGELDGSSSERAQRVSACFGRGGFKSPVLADIRAEIWLKLWGNVSFNPISALTRATLVDMCQNRLTRELVAGMMREAAAVAAKLGISFRVPLEKRIAGAERLGHHKPSMLVDAEAGRDLELAALVGAVVEIGRLTNTPTPLIDAVHALVSLLAVTAARQRRESSEGNG